MHHCGQLSIYSPRFFALMKCYPARSPAALELPDPVSPAVIARAVDAKARWVANGRMARAMFERMVVGDGR
jgi:hypothetical protein